MAESDLILYVSSVSANMEVKKRQNRIEMILQSKGINFTNVDIAACEENKNKMREICGDPKAMPPQLTRGDTYLGDFDAFDDAVEEERLEEFLKQV